MRLKKKRKRKEKKGMKFPTVPFRKFCSAGQDRTGQDRTGQDRRGQPSTAERCVSPYDFSGREVFRIQPVLLFRRPRNVLVRLRTAVFLRTRAHVLFPFEPLGGFYPPKAQTIGPAKDC